MISPSAPNLNKFNLLLYIGWVVEQRWGGECDKLFVFSHTTHWFSTHSIYKFMNEWGDVRPIGVYKPHFLIVSFVYNTRHTYSINMKDNLRERVIRSIKERAISILVDKKYALDEAFANGLINYAEYEENKWLIDNELDSLTQ